MQNSYNQCIRHTTSDRGPYWWCLLCISLYLYFCVYLYFRLYCVQTMFELCCGRPGIRYSTSVSWAQGCSLCICICVCICDCVCVCVCVVYNPWLSCVCAAGLGSDTPHQSVEHNGVQFRPQCLNCIWPRTDLTGCACTVCSVHIVHSVHTILQSVLLQWMLVSSWKCLNRK